MAQTTAQWWSPQLMATMRLPRSPGTSVKRVRLAVSPSPSCPK